MIETRRRSGAEQAGHLSFRKFSHHRPLFRYILFTGSFWIHHQTEVSKRRLRAGGLSLVINYLSNDDNDSAVGKWGIWWDIYNLFDVLSYLIPCFENICGVGWVRIDFVIPITLYNR